MEPVFETVPAREVALTVTPLLTKAHFNKLKVIEACETLERYMLNKTGMRALLDFRKDYPNSSQAVELQHMEQLAHTLGND